MKSLEVDHHFKLNSWGANSTKLYSTSSLGRVECGVELILADGVGAARVWVQQSGNPAPAAKGRAVWREERGDSTQSSLNRSDADPAILLCYQSVISTADFHTVNAIK